MKRNHTVCLLVIAVLTCAHAAWAQLASSSWPKFHRDYSSTGVGLYASTSSELRWTFQAGGAIRSAPVTGVDGTIYFTSTDGNLYAVDSSGLGVWAVNCGCSGTTAPAVGSDGTIYVGSNDGSLYAVRADGSLKWKKVLGSRPDTSVAMGRDGSIYVGCVNGAFYALRADGGQKWVYSAGGAISSSAAIAADGTIYFGCQDSKVYALTSTGTLKWKFSPVGSGAFYASPALGSDGTVYIGSAGGFFYAITPSGTQKWRASAGGDVRSSAAIYTDGTIYYGCRDGRIRSVSSGGIQQWAFGTGQYTDASPALDSGGSVFAASLNGKLYALNPDGTELWNYDTGSAIYSSPAIGPEGAIIVGADNGMLYCFAAGSGTPGAPVVSDEGQFTSSLDTLSATWTEVIFAKGISGYEYSIGTAAGQANVRDWKDVGMQTNFTDSNLTLTHGVTYYINVRARSAEGKAGKVGSSDGVTVDATPPAVPTVTDAGAFTASTTSLSASWSSSDPESGVVEYMYAVGSAPGATDQLSWTSAGMQTSMVITSLDLQNGVKYYVSVKARNGANLVSAAGSSDGITVDTTPPSTPVVTDDGPYTQNSTRLRATWVSTDPETGVVKNEYSIGTAPGLANVWPWTDAGQAAGLDKSGLNLQQGVTYYINVRTTNGLGMVSEVGSSDGITVDKTPPDAVKVTDDGNYTANATQLHAVVECEDRESGIAAYECAVGTSPGGTDVAIWRDAGPGPHVYIGNLQLQNGVTYYISARAVNGVGLTGPVGTSNGIKLDTTPPVVLSVTDDGQFTDTGDRLRGRWSASDPESGIAAYKYCIGTSPGLDDAAAWMNVGPATEHTREGLSLISGQTYYITVVAISGAGGESAPMSSDGIMPDLTPPTTPVVTDSGQYWAHKTFLPVSWSSDDPESGVVSYRISLGTAPGVSDVVEWNELGLATSTTITGLHLQNGVIYYANVQAKNGMGVWSAVGSSDGITLDVTPPSAPVIIDDGDSTLMHDRLHAKWRSEDPESGIAEYVYCIGTSPGSTDVTPWTSAGTSEDVTVTGLRLEPLLTYYFSVKARSNAGAWSVVSTSDGIEYSTGAAIWWKFRNGSHNLGRQQFKGTRVANLAWEVCTLGYVESSPAIASDGTTYIGSGDGSIYAITQNGTIRWTFDTGAPIDSSPAVTQDGRIVIGSNNGRLYCLSPAGEVVWVYQAKDAIRSSPLVVGNRVYVGSNDTCLHAVDLKTGAKAWTYKTDDAVWSSPACDGQGNIYFASGDTYIYALNPNGTLKWRYLTGSATDASPAIGEDGTVYIGSGDGHFYAIRPDGTLKWRYNARIFCDSSAAIDESGNIYFGVGLDGGDGQLIALRPDGSKMWSIDFPKGGIISSPAIDSTGMIYVGSCDEHLYAISPEGTICWSFKTLCSVASSPAIGADSSVVFGSFDGGVYCLRDENARDLTPPTKPVVTTPAVIGINQPLTASWIATDPDTTVAEYTYAIGTTPAATDIAYWTSTGTGTGIAINNLGLEIGKTYYVSVKARNPSQRWSEIGFSQGTTVLENPATYRISEVKALPDQTPVSLQGKVVGAVFADCFFIQEPNRSAGIRCLYTGVKPAIGDTVNLSGSVYTLNGERVLAGVTLTKTDSGPAPSPLGICGKVYKGMKPDPFGISVRLWGKVTSAGPGYCVIDGTTGPLPAGTQPGVQIRTAGIAVAKGDYVIAEGVLCCEEIEGHTATVLRVASPENVSVR